MGQDVIALNDTTSVGQLNPITIGLLVTDLLLMSRGASQQGYEGVGDYKITAQQLSDWIVARVPTVDLSSYARSSAVATLQTTANYLATNKVDISSIIDNLTSNNPSVPLSANQGRVLASLISSLTSVVSGKLDASSYNEYFKGVFGSAGSLTADFPAANNGDYAIVDNGTDPATQYIWSPEGWVAGSSAGGGSISTTDQLPEGSTNLYFTALRAVAAVANSFVRFDELQSLTQEQILNTLTTLGLNASAYWPMATYADTLALLVTDSTVSDAPTKTPQTLLVGSIRNQTYQWALDTDDWSTLVGIRAGDYIQVPNTSAPTAYHGFTYKPLDMALVLDAVNGILQPMPKQPEGVPYPVLVNAGNSPYQAIVKTTLYVDVSGGPVTVLMPTSHNPGDVVKFVPAAGSYSVNNLTLSSSDPFDSTPGDVLVDIDNLVFEAQWYSGILGWILNQR